MQLTLDPNQATYMIDAIKPGEIIINETSYTNSLILSTSILIDDWPIGNFNELTAEHFVPILKLQPKLVILGTGNTHQFLPAKLQAIFLEKHIGIETMNTHAACRTFNVCMSESREAVAALIL